MTAEPRFDAAERAELEQLRLATRMSGLYTWSFELDDRDLASVKGTFTHLWRSLGYEEDDAPPELGAILALVIARDPRWRTSASRPPAAGRTRS